MPKRTRKSWPFKFAVRETVVTLLMTPIHEPYVVVFQLKSCQLVIDQSVERLGIDYNVSMSPDGKQIKWALIDNSLSLQDLHNHTEALVIRSYP
jgi:hypothetical protein